MCELQCIIYSQRLIVYNSEVIFLGDYGRQNNAHPSSPKDICLLRLRTCDYVGLLAKDELGCTWN